jgi:chromosome partitioning protein
MGKVLSLTNQKGGVAKTTTAINLAAGLALFGKRVLLVDLDPQGNATSGLGFVDGREPSIYHALIGEAEMEDLIRATKVPGLDLIGSSDDLSGAEVELAASFDRSIVLRDRLRPLAARYDFVLIDSPPSLGLLTVNGLTTADAVLVPLQAEYYAMEGLSKLLRTVELVRAGLNRALSIEGIVVTMYDGRNTICRQVADQIRSYFGEAVFTAMIPRNVRLSEAPSHGLSIFDYDPASRGAEAYLALAREFLVRNGQDAPPLEFERSAGGAA